MGCQNSTLILLKSHIIS